MNADPTAIPGCSVRRLVRHCDDRGDFVKAFAASAPEPAGADPTVAELFWSHSQRGVVRGLHFQVPPHAQHKLVTIVSGTAIDVVVDLRVGSPAFGVPCIIALDAAIPTAISIPVGCAHGFQATTDDTTMLYATSTEHVPDADQGIRWDSIGVAWPIADVVISDRDMAFPGIEEFTSPFRFAVQP